MKIMAVEKDRQGLAALKSYIEKNHYGCEVVGFTSSADAEEYFTANPVDAVYIEVMLRCQSGLALARTLRRSNPRLYVAFVAEKSDYALDAFNLHANDYILKPLQ